MVKIFDTHAHYDDEWFGDERTDIINSLKENGVLAVTNIGASLETSRATVELTKKYDFFYGAVGVHPSEIKELEGTDGIDRLKKMAEDNEKIVAIGEIGLDYHYEDTDEALQKKWFVEQMKLASKLDLPIIIHSRDAAKDTIDIMRAENARELKGVVHCYSYSKELAKDFLDMDYYFGVGGVVTFSNGRKLKEAVEYIPLEKIVLETDAPYLAPNPFRGKRNCSSYICYVAEEIARLKNVSIDKVYETTYENALKLYDIKK